MAEADPAHPPKSAQAAVRLDAIKIVRSDFLDAFARIETRVGACLEAAGQKPNYSAPFSQRRDLLNGILANVKGHKKLADDLQEVAHFRNDIVHSRLMLLCDHAELKNYICFEPVPIGFNARIVMTVEEFHKKISDAKRAAHHLDQLLEKLKKPEKASA